MAFRKFKINWVLKAHTFNALDRIPGGEKIYYLLQRHVTKTVPRKLSPTKETGQGPISHANKFKEHGVGLSGARFLEFGAGWDLYSNMIMYCMGVNRQDVVDIRRWARAEAINAVIHHLQADPPEGAVRMPERLVSGANLEKDLVDFYGISYQAPADARHLPVPDASFDLIATTSTLEHIPRDVLHDIMKECSRILKPGGLMGHVIDYSDHYAHSDPNINEFNYLRYDEKQWGRFNPGIHYQNRLRAPFYKKLFEENGFELVELTPWKGYRERLEETPVNKMFQELSFEELRELGGYYLLRRL